MKKIDYSKRGPLIKVQIGPGRFVKMYERDAIARGLVKKERPQAVNKMLVPDEEKSPITPPKPSHQAGRENTPPQPTPQAGREMTPPRPSPALPSRGEGKKGKRKKADSVLDREVGGSIPPGQAEGDDPTPTLPSSGEGELEE